LDVVGFGYDVFGNYADIRSLMPFQLFDLGAPRDQPIGAYVFRVPAAVSPQNVPRRSVTRVEGEDRRDYAQSMAVTIGLSADARRDINVMNPRQLFEHYGAYYVASAYLGGRHQ